MDRLLPLSKLVSWPAVMYVALHDRWAIATLVQVEDLPSRVIAATEGSMGVRRTLSEVALKGMSCLLY